MAARWAGLRSLGVLARNPASGVVQGLLHNPAGGGTARVLDVATFGRVDLAVGEFLGRARIGQTGYRLVEAGPGPRLRGELARLPGRRGLGVAHHRIGGTLLRRQTGQCLSHMLLERGGMAGIGPRHVAGDGMDFRPGADRVQPCLGLVVLGHAGKAAFPQDGVGHVVHMPGIEGSLGGGRRGR